MQTIYDELKYAEILLESQGRRMLWARDYMILAKYFMTKKGMPLRKAEVAVFDYASNHAEGYNETLFAEDIIKAVRRAKGKELRLPKDVIVTKKELDIIKGVNNYRYEKILFVMLVLSKANHKEDNNSGKYYISKAPGEIFRLAHTTQKKGENIMGYLYSIGLLEHSNLYGGAFEILFVDKEKDWEVGISVNNMENIASEYPFFCEKCGKIIEKKTKFHTKCDVCYDEYRKEVIKNNAQRYRNKKK